MFFLKIKKTYLQLFTHKYIVRLRDKTAQWRHTSKHLLIKNKMIMQSYC